MLLRKDLAERLMALVSEVHEVIDLLIVDELALKLPWYEQQEADAARVLAEATEALAAPRAELARLDEELFRAEGEAARYGGQSSDKNLETRVAARQWFASWQEEIALLKAARDQREAAMEPLVAAHNAARTALDQAQNERAALELNLQAPHLGHGQLTESYGFRSTLTGALIAVALTGDTSHPEWQKATDLIDTMCSASGHYPEEPNSARAVAAAMQAEIDERTAAGLSSGIPGGGDVSSAFVASLVNSFTPPEADGSVTWTRDVDIAAKKKQAKQEAKAYQRLRDIAAR